MARSRSFELPVGEQIDVVPFGAIAHQPNALDVLDKIKGLFDQEVITPTNEESEHKNTGIVTPVQQHRFWLAFNHGRYNPDHLLGFNLVGPSARGDSSRQKVAKLVDPFMVFYPRPSSILYNHVSCQKIEKDYQNTGVESALTYTALQSAIKHRKVFMYINTEREYLKQWVEDVVGLELSPRTEPFTWPYLLDGTELEVTSYESQGDTLDTLIYMEYTQPWLLRATKTVDL
jgi:hypothetical protein